MPSSVFGPFYFYSDHVRAVLSLYPVFVDCMLQVVRPCLVYLILPCAVSDSVRALESRIASSRVFWSSGLVMSCLVFVSSILYLCGLVLSTILSLALFSLVLLSWSFLLPLDLFFCLGFGLRLRLKSTHMGLSRVGLSLRLRCKEEKTRWERCLDKILTWRVLAIVSCATSEVEAELEGGSGCSGGHFSHKEILSLSLSVFLYFVSVVSFFGPCLGPCLGVPTKIERLQINLELSDFFS
jgi:hypothetical protein